MKLMGMDNCRVTLLTVFRRPPGQLYIPKAAVALAERYQFQNRPGPNDFAADSYTFRIGNYRDVQIQDITFYNDGIVISSASATETLEEFLSDLLKWMAESWDLVESGIPPREIHRESAIIFSSEIDLEKPFKTLSSIGKKVTASQEGYGLRPFKFDLIGFALGPDPIKYTGRKPGPFSIGRRLNVPYDANIFHSVAPMMTKDHIAFIEELEREWGR